MSNKVLFILSIVGLTSMTSLSHAEEMGETELALADTPIKEPELTPELKTFLGYTSEDTEKTPEEEVFDILSQVLEKADEVDSKIPLSAEDKALLKKVLFKLATSPSLTTGILAATAIGAEEVLRRLGITPVAEKLIMDYVHTLPPEMQNTLGTVWTTTNDIKDTFFNTIDEVQRVALIGALKGGIKLIKTADPRNPGEVIGGVGDIAKDIGEAELDVLSPVGDKAVRGIENLNNIDIDPSKVDLSKITVPKISLPKIDLPKINIPKIKLPW